VRLAGRAKIEQGAFIGIGATVLPRITIGYESVIGAGAVVIDDIPPMTTAVGVPARPIKHATADEETAAMLLPARV
jgi:acetyltransferase EpsM